MLSPKSPKKNNTKNSFDEEDQNNNNTSIDNYGSIDDEDDEEDNYIDKMNALRLQGFISPPYTPQYKKINKFEVEGGRYAIKNRNLSNNNNSIFFIRPTRMVARGWFIAELILCALLLTCINVDNFCKIEHNCPTSLNYEQLTLYVNLYGGMSSKDGGCKNKSFKQKINNEYCMGFDPRSSSLWVKIDNILNSHMAYDVSITLPAIQFLLASAVFFAGLTFLTHGMLLTSRLMSDKNLYKIIYWGMLYLCLTFILTSISFILMNTSTDVLSPEKWGNLYEQGYTVAEIFSSVSNSTDINPTNIANAANAVKLCSVNMEYGPGYISIFFSVLWSFMLIIIIVFNGCCHRISYCEDDSPADELDSNERESRKSLINHR
jgi:hypothetical protein